MRENALQIANQYDTEQLKLNHLREYLQHLILRESFEINWLSNLVFHGGTALRILHNLNRFSEDLDFHLKRPNRNYSMGPKLNNLKKNLELNGYEIDVSLSTSGNVKNGMIKFAGGLLQEAGISPHENQKLNIKLEIDTNPPEGFNTDKSLINQYFPLALVHHDRRSFFSGKCHAILQREWAKGRDFFDLLFYLNKWEDVKPNFDYLNNALLQTGYEGSHITQENWKGKLLERVNEVSWARVEEDVKPFLLSQKDLEIFSKNFLIKELT